jgi:hypothetical protein
LFIIYCIEIENIKDEENFSKTIDLKLDWIGLDWIGIKVFEFYLSFFFVLENTNENISLLMLKKTKNVKLIFYSRKKKEKNNESKKHH